MITKKICKDGQNLINTVVYRKNNIKRLFCRFEREKKNGKDG